jgi:hypothetical protein
MANLREVTKAKIKDSAIERNSPVGLKELRTVRSWRHLAEVDLPVEIPSTPDHAARLGHWLGGDDAPFRLLPSQSSDGNDRSIQDKSTN